MLFRSAEKRVKLGLIVNSIVDTNDLEPDEDKVREKIETMSNSYQDPQEVINFYYNNEQQLSQIQNMVLEEQIVNLVLGTANVTEKAVSYEEAVKRGAPETAGKEPEDAENSDDD